MYAALTFFGNGKLICKSSSAADNGKTVSVTDGKKSWSAIMTDGVCTFTLPGKQKYTVCLLNGDNAEYVTEVFFGFGECKELEVGMDKTTWKGLKAILNAGLETEMLAVGDQISATVAGETQVFDIVHVDYRPSVYGRNIILAKHTLLPEGRQMRTTPTNAGGYKSTLIAQYLDDTYYNSLPSDMKSVITKMVFKGTIGGNSKTLQDEEHMVWIPLESNLFNSITQGFSEEISLGGNEQFAYFATTGNRIRTLGNTNTAAVYWLATPESGSGVDSFATVNVQGTSAHTQSQGTNGVLPCFMIAADAE